MRFAVPGRVLGSRSLPLTLAVLSLFGCGPPNNLVVLVPDEIGHVGRAVVTQSGQSIDLTRSLSAAAAPTASGPASGGAEQSLLEDQIIDAFAGALAGQPRAPESWVVFFEPDGTTLVPSSVETLALAVKAAQQSLFPDVSVIGHADATGSPELRRALASARAQAVLGTLIASGIPATAVDLAPLVRPIPPGPFHEIGANPGNRGVEIIVR